MPKCFKDHAGLTCCDQLAVLRHASYALGLLGAMTDNRDFLIPLLNYLVSEGNEHRWHCDPEHPGSARIND